MTDLFSQTPPVDPLAGGVPGGSPPAAGQSSKPYLPGPRAPSEGAHRLIWWMLEGVHEQAGAMATLRAKGIGKELIDRIVAGEVVPEQFVAIELAQATGGAVLPQDFTSGRRPFWGDRPAARPQS